MAFGAQGALLAGVGLQWRAQGGLVLGERDAQFALAPVAHGDAVELRVDACAQDAQHARTGSLLAQRPSSTTGGAVLMGFVKILANPQCQLVLFSY